MKRFLIITLVLLHVLICTIGQGALTLCVRRDGSQQLQWTYANDCRSLRSESHAACGHEACCDHEDEAAGVARFCCNPCTDYVLIAEINVVTKTTHAPLSDDACSLCWYMPVVLENYLPHNTVPLVHSPPSNWYDTQLAGISSVMLRC